MNDLNMLLLCFRTKTSGMHACYYCQCLDVRDAWLAIKLKGELNNGLTGAAFFASFFREQHFVTPHFSASSLADVRPRVSLCLSACTEIDKCGTNLFVINDVLICNFMNSSLIFNDNLAITTCYVDFLLTKKYLNVMSQLTRRVRHWICIACRRCPLMALLRK